MKNLSEELSKTMHKPKYGQRYQALVNHVLDDSDIKSFLQEHHDQLQPDVVHHSIAKLYEFVNEKNKIKMGKPTTIPGYQPILVVNNKLIDISYIPTQERKQQLEDAKVLKRIHVVAMPKDIKHISLNNFDFGENEYRFNAMQVVTDFIANYISSPKNKPKGMYLYGEFGVGKTYLMAAMANEMAKKGYNITLVHFPSFAVDIKNAISNNQVAFKLDDIKKTPILVLDDIGADSMSSWIRDDVLGVILEYRMQNNLTTFFTSNFSMDQFEHDHLRVNIKGDEEPLKAKRIMQRIRFLAQEVEMFGKNHRLE
jgi:primosomal protein DnaI